MRFAFDWVSVPAGVDGCCATNSSSRIVVDFSRGGCRIGKLRKGTVGNSAYFIYFCFNLFIPGVSCSQFTILFVTVGICVL